MKLVQKLMKKTSKYLFYSPLTEKVLTECPCIYIYYRNILTLTFFYYRIDTVEVRHNVDKRGAWHWLHLSAQARVVIHLSPTFSSNRTWKEFWFGTAFSATDNSMKHLNVLTRVGNLLMISSLAPRHTMLTLRQLWVLIIVDNWARSRPPSVHSPRRQIASELCCQMFAATPLLILLPCFPSILMSW